MNMVPWWQDVFCFVGTLNPWQLFRRDSRAFWGMICGHVTSQNVNYKKKLFSIEGNVSCYNRLFPVRSISFFPNRILYNAVDNFQSLFLFEFFLLHKYCDLYLFSMKRNCGKKYFIWARNNFLSHEWNTLLCVIMYIYFCWPKIHSCHRENSCHKKLKLIIWNQFLSQKIKSWHMKYIPVTRNQFLSQKKNNSCHKESVLITRNQFYSQKIKYC